MSEYKGIAVGGLVTGISAGVLSLANAGVFNGVLGGGRNGGSHGENACVNRYEAAMSARIAELETEVKLRDANTYTLGEVSKLRDYVDRRFAGVEAQISTQAVVNAQVAANLSCLQGNVAMLMGLTKTVIPIDNICPQPAVATTTTAA